MDLEIADGEFMALLGPSGCGKSTTMNMIAGMEEPTSGRILFGEPRHGRRADGQARRRLRLPELRDLHPHDGAREPRLRPEDARRAEGRRSTAASAPSPSCCSSTPLLDRKADRLSVNILQRVAIGRSAIMEPAIFLLDEPLSNVDAAFRAVMRTELKHLQRQFRQTMVYVTHDQLEAMTMADRIAVMDHGVLQQVGTPLEVYNNPANVFVARFIGAPGMNLLKGTAGARAIVAWSSISVRSARRRRFPTLIAAALRGTQGRRALRFPAGAGDAGATTGRGLPMPVTFVERIGARTIVHLGDGESGREGGVRQRCRAGDRRDAVVAPTRLRCASSMPRPAARSGRSEAMAEIAFRNVTKRYGDTVAVGDASFTVDGQRVLLLLRSAAVGQVDDPAPDPRAGNAG